MIWNIDDSLKSLLSMLWETLVSYGTVKRNHPLKLELVHCPLNFEFAIA